MKAPPTPEPITLASLETTRTRTFVSIFSLEKDGKANKKIPRIKIKKISPNPDVVILIPQQNNFRIE
jgi:hypothetical protein